MNNTNETISPLMLSGMWTIEADIIELCKRNNMTDDFARVLRTVSKFGPLPRYALRELYPDGFTHSLKKAKKIGAIYVKNGCVGRCNGNDDPERAVNNNNVMQRLFAVLSEINKTTHIAYFDFGTDTNELVFVAQGRIFKLILVRAGEEKFLNQKYNHEALDATEMIRYIPVVTTSEQINALQIQETFMYCKLSYLPNAWSVDWIGAD